MCVRVCVCVCVYVCAARMTEENLISFTELLLMWGVLPTKAREAQQSDF